MQITHFKAYSKQDVLSLTKLRRFETKIGERLHVLADPNNISDSVKAMTARYVLVGIPEDIGVQANEGIGGTSTAWLSFFSSFHIVLFFSARYRVIDNFRKLCLYLR